MSGFAKPENCFNKPQVSTWDGHKRFICQYSGCLVTKGVSFKDANNNHLGMFVNEQWALDAKKEHPKYKDKPLELVELLVDDYVTRKAAASSSSANGSSSARQPKPTYHAFFATKSGKVMDTEYMGKCTDPIAVISSKLRDNANADDQKFTLTLSSLNKGNAVRVSKTAAGPWVIVTDTYALSPLPDEFKLEDSVLEHRKLKSGKGKAAANAPAAAAPVVLDLTDDDEVKKPSKKRARKEKEVVPKEEAAPKKATKTPNASPKKQRAKPKPKAKPSNDVTPPVSGDDE